METWVHPERLSEKNQEAKNTDTENIKAFGGDFGAYGYINRTGKFDDCDIASHNNLNPIRLINHISPYLKGIKINKIADLGCGLGLTSNALAERFDDAKVYGYEISTEAIEYAKRTFKKPVFQLKGIDKNTVFNHSFSFILAQQFYPFTREITPHSSLDYPISIMRVCLEHLEDKGMFVIADVLDNPSFIDKRLGECRKAFPEYSFTVKVTYPSKIVDTFLFSNRYLSILYCLLCKGIFWKMNFKLTSLILITKKQSHS
ncbi:MAG: methyltransferase [bacterium]